MILLQSDQNINLTWHTALHCKELLTIQNMLDKIQAINLLQLKCENSTFQYGPVIWIGRHASFPPRRSVNQMNA